MCGFIAVFSRNAPVDPDRLAVAAGTLRHRGPDADGQMVEEVSFGNGGSVHVGFAHTRLSILDLDHRSDQPFVRRNLILAYNGEIYNFRPLRSDLELSGVGFETEGDTEVLLEAIAARGPAALGGMSGQWAFALLDRDSGTLLASRDRFGKKPLFRYQDRDRIILASTVRAISTYLDERPTFTSTFVERFLADGFYYTRPEESPFERIEQVGPGTVQRFDLRSWTSTTETYFGIGAEAASFAPDADLPAVLEKAVRRRLVSDRPVGLLLSGGVDSSLILSILKSTGLHDQVTCFIGETGLSDDAVYARQAAAACGIEPRVIAIDYGGAALGHFLKVCRHQERPFPLFGNLIAMPQLFEQIAETDIRVVLDGTGADKIFGGYWDRQFPFALRDGVRRGDLRWLAKAAATTPPSQLRRLLIAARDAIRLRTNSNDPLGDPKLSFDEALIADVRCGRLADWLWQNDRNAMMYGIEARSPFLDMDCAPFIGSGYRRKFNGRHNKLELRRAFGAFVELPTQWRVQKQGFRWNAAEFIRRNAAPLADIVSASTYIPPQMRDSAVSELRGSSEMAQQTYSCISLAAVEHEVSRL